MKDPVERSVTPPRPFGLVTGDALLAYPGPALVLDRSGAVVSTNSRADALRSAIQSGLVSGIPVLTAPGTGQPRQSVVESLPVPGGGAILLELTALPLDGGSTLILGRDVTLDRNLRGALVESRQRYKDLVEVSSDFAWETGPDGRFVFVSPKGAMGYAADELVGRHPSEFTSHPNQTPGPAVFSATLPVTDAEVWLLGRDGRDVCLLASAMPMKGQSGGWIGARGVCRNVTDQRARDAALLRAQSRERLLTYVVRTIRDEVDPTDMLRAAAEATGRALNASGCQIFRVLPGQMEFTLAAQYGNVGAEASVLQSLTQSDYFDDRVDGWLVLASITRYRHAVNGAICLWRAADRAGWGDDERLLIDDVASQVGLASEQIANHERILLLSRTDAMTGLFNRRAFFDELARRFQRLSRDGRPATLIYCDLDNFKLVNDVHGHKAGDEALLALRDILMKYSRPIDLVARLGGDEFALWLEGADEAAAQARCSDIVSGADALKKFSGMPSAPLGISLGAAVFRGGSRESMDDLLARADLAMYHVKRDGKGTWAIAPEPKE